MIKDKLNIGLRGHDVEAENLPELSKKLKEYGINNVQLVLKRSCKDFKEGMFSPSFAKQIGEIFKVNDIEISVLGCYINPSNTNKEVLEKDMAYFVESLKYARFMNAGVVGLETGFVGEECIPENNQTEEAYQYLLSNMKVLRDAAEKLGVMIAVEAVSCFVINSPERMLRLLNDLDSPNILVIFDLLNLLTIENYKNQEEIIDTAFELLGDKISVIHLKDFIVEENLLKQCPIGEGLINIEKILSIIKTRKPNIPIILEETRGEDSGLAINHLNRININ
ncbi:MAG: sugar phosphate isomerase/epimerase [Clostridia bacterium]|nr:sugar phosphate isomerase/epimerase [Clostridia bacterium]